MSVETDPIGLYACRRQGCVGRGAHLGGVAVGHIHTVLDHAHRAGLTDFHGLDAVLQGEDVVQRLCHLGFHAHLHNALAAVQGNARILDHLADGIGLGVLDDFQRGVLHQLHKLPCLLGGVDIKAVMLLHVAPKEDAVCINHMDFTDAQLVGQGLKLRRVVLGRRRHL